MSVHMSTGREIHLTENADGQWTARDESVGVSAQGATRGETLEALDDVVAAIEGDGGRPPTDEELRELGIDPEDNTSGGGLPDVLQ